MTDFDKAASEHRAARQLLNDARRAFRHASWEGNASKTEAARIAMRNAENLLEESAARFRAAFPECH